MTYNGYFDFGGIELANSARSQAYAQTFGFGALRGCEPCADLGEVLGFGTQRGDPHRQEVLSVWTNRFTNPSAETNSSGFPTLGSGVASVTRVTTPSSAIYSGSAGFAVTGSGTPATNPYIETAQFPVSTGEIMALSFRARHHSGALPMILQVRFIYRDAGGTIIPSSTWVGGTIGASPLSDDSTKFVATSQPISGSVASVSIRLSFVGNPSSGPASPGFVVHMDGFVVSTGIDTDAAMRDRVNTFYDGATADTYNVEYAWTGTANLSTSTKTTYAYYGDIIASGSYESPSIDPAPWFDPGRRASEDFLGFYVTRADGIDDSTRQANLSDLTGDGTSVSRVRRAGREMRFEGVLMALTDEGLDAGLSWLESSLDSYRCDGGLDGCKGADLRFFSSCPEIQQSSPVDLVLNWDGTNPAAEAARWTGFGGGIFVATGAVNFAASTPPSGYIEREITNLVSGQWYQVTLNIAGQGRISVEAGNAVAAMPAVGSTLTGVLPFRMEFLARSSTEKLRIRGTGPLSSLGSNLAFTGLRIERTRVGSNMMSSTFYPTTGGVDSGPWATKSLTVPATPFQQTLLPVSVASQNPDTLRTYTSGQLSWRKVRLSTSATLATSSGVTRTSLGTLPAGNYRVEFWMHADWNIPALVGSVSFTASVGAFSSATATTTTKTGGSGNPTKYTIDFTVASEGEAFMDVVATIGAATTVAANNYLEVTPVLLLLTNLSNQVSVPSPDSTLKFWRTLHNVTAIGGPVVREHMRMSCGVGARVSFDLVAGDPRKYKVERSLGRHPIATYASALSARCRNDQVYRYNRIANPTFDTDLADWTNVGTSTTPFVWNTAGIPGYETAGYGPGRAQGGIAANGQTLALTTMVPIPVSGWYHTLFAGVLNGALGSWTVSVGTTPGGNDLVSGVSATPHPGSSAWQLYADFYINSEGTPFPAWREVWVTYRLTSTTATTATAVQLDAMLVGDGRYDLSDGWFGGRQATNYLTWYQTEPPRVEPISISPSVDSILVSQVVPSIRQAPSPCLRFPVVPRPPETPSDCTGVRWSFEHRTEIQVAPGALSTSGIVVPIARLFIRDEAGFIGSERAVRMIRLRWYRNPTGRPVIELDPCSFEAEISVAGAPVNAWTTIDAERRTITTESAPSNGGDFNIEIPQAAFGPDMGGVVWPELRCGEQYTLVVDVSEGGVVAGYNPVWPASYVEIGLVPVA